MNGNLTVGRFGGVELRLNWSLLAVVALIVWSLADGVFPSQNPGLSHNTYLGMAVVASLLFLASIALHELGHSWVARREGIEVDSIALWLFGGVSQLKGRFKSPGVEFRVAAPGRSSRSCWAFCSWSSRLPARRARSTGSPPGSATSTCPGRLQPAAGGASGRRARAAFHPLAGQGGISLGDPGRIGGRPGFRLPVHRARPRHVHLRGGVQRRLARLHRRFLLQGARAEARYVATEQALGGLRVRDLMVRHPVTVDADSTIGRFMDDVAWSHRFTTYPVLDGDRPVGLLPSPRSPRFPAPTGIRDASGTRCSRSTTSRCSPRTSWPWTPSRSCPHRPGIVGSWWTMDTWPDCCRSPTSHERSKWAETRPSHLHPGRHDTPDDEYDYHGNDQADRAGVLNVGYAEAGPATAGGPPPAWLAIRHPQLRRRRAPARGRGLPRDRPLPARLRHDAIPLRGHGPKRPAGGPRPRRRSR